MKSNPEDIESCTTDSPVGLLRLGAITEALTEVHFLDRAEPQETDHPVLKQALRQLREYFDGSHTAFDLPVQPMGTDFQRRVWDAVRDIPYGQTATYGELADKLGDRNSIRAVGRANGQNPLPIIIPCHRVVGADGKLVGYSGGIERKQWLLKHEGALLL